MNVTLRGTKDHDCKFRINVDLLQTFRGELAINRRHNNLIDKRICARHLRGPSVGFVLSHVHARIRSHTHFLSNYRDHAQQGEYD